jgi:hypothetical protein
VSICSQVHAYRLSAQHAGGIKPAPGWAHAIGAVRRPKTGSSSGSIMMVCFSRQSLAKASLVPNIDPSSKQTGHGRILGGISLQAGGGGVLAGGGGG